MMKKGFKIPTIVFTVAMLFSLSHAVVAENQAGYTVEVELIPENQNITVIPGFQPVRQESLVDDFERAAIAPWTTTGYTWGIRDIDLLAFRLLILQGTEETKPEDCSRHQSI
jgi:hypothetical protein